MPIVDSLEILLLDTLFSQLWGIVLYPELG